MLLWIIHSPASAFLIMLCAAHTNELRPSGSTLSTFLADVGAIVGRPRVPLKLLPLAQPSAIVSIPTITHAAATCIRTRMAICALVEPGTVGTMNSGSYPISALPMK